MWLILIIISTTLVSKNTFYEEKLVESNKDAGKLVEATIDEYSPGL